MKKIIVIGCPGSGKSTFSRKLHEKTKIDVYHLDNLFWNEDKTTVEKEVFLKRVHEVLNKESWILDGNYLSTMKLRLDACDTVIFLDYDTPTCIQGVYSRIGKKREDIPWVEEKVDEEFMEFILKFSSEQRPVILEMLENTSKNVLIFRNRIEAEGYLKK